MAITTLAIVALAFSLDLLFGEPPNAVHPMAWFGRLVGAVDRDRRDRDDGRRDRVVGAAIALCLPLVPAAAAASAVVLATALSPVAGGIVAAIALFLSTSLRRLLERASDVLAATETDEARARELLRRLAGFDAADLSPGQIRSAAVESAVEHLSDGVLATLLPFALLGPISLPAAAATAAWVGGIDAVDSTHGSPEKPIGAASARLADAVTWLPARIAAVCIAVAAADPGALSRARNRKETPSSAGWPATTLAAVLDVRLERPGAYVVNPGASLPTAETGKRALTLVGLAAALGVALAAFLATVSATLVGSPEPVVLAID